MIQDDAIEQKPTFAPLSCFFACFFLLFICLFLFLPRSGIGLRRRKTIPTAEQPLPPSEKLNDIYGETIDSPRVVASEQIASWV
jgi:hypothetical protein